MEPGSLTVAGEDVRVFLRDRQRVLVPAVLEEVVAEIPIYRRLPRELIDGDVRQVVVRAVQLFIASIELDGHPPEASLGELTESAIRRAEEGIPMETVLSAYFRGTRVCTDAIGNAAGPDDIPALVEVIRLLMVFMEEVTGAVGAGYARHSRTTVAEHTTARHVLANALLDGHGQAEAAVRAGVTLPAAYLCVSVVAGPHPDEEDPQVDCAVATRRKLRRLRDEFDRHYSQAGLWIPANDGGLALLPEHGDEPRAVDRLDEVIAEIGRASGIDLYAGVVRAEPDEVPASAKVAREIVEVARGTGADSGVFTLTDVALEYQLTRASHAQPVLAALLDPLEEHRDLITTLRTYIATGLDRRRCANRLHVHPNTVDNRLRRIAELTGLDPASGSDLPTITAALAARPQPRDAERSSL